jgi:hypothetical protein
MPLMLRGYECGVRVYSSASKLDHWSAHYKGLGIRLRSLPWQQTSWRHLLRYTAEMKRCTNDQMRLQCPLTAVPGSDGYDTIGQKEFLASACRRKM